MSGFLTRLVRRTLGEAGGLSARPRSRFEPARAVPGGSVTELDALPVDDVPIDADLIPDRPVGASNAVRATESASLRSAAAPSAAALAVDRIPADDMSRPPASSPSSLRAVEFRPPIRERDGDATIQSDEPKISSIEGSASLPPATMAHADRPVPRVRDAAIPMAVPVAQNASVAGGREAPIVSAAVQPPVQPPSVGMKREGPLDEMPRGHEAVATARPSAILLRPRLMAFDASLETPNPPVAPPVYSSSRLLHPIGRVESAEAAAVTPTEPKETMSVSARPSFRARPSLPPASSPAPQVPATVEIRLGRIEVRADAPATPAVRNGALARLPSLADHLARPRGR